MSKENVPLIQTGQLNPGEKKIVFVKGKELGVFNVRGEFFVVQNICPHMGAPLCKGTICDKIHAEKPGLYIVEQSPILRCPWHSWEFDLRTGKSLVDDKLKARVYEVILKDGYIYCRI
jgi:nitrite reductase (NADH) small subunit